MADINSDAIVQSLSLGQSAAGAVKVKGVLSKGLSVGLTAPGKVIVATAVLTNSLSMAQAAVASAPAKIAAVTHSLTLSQSARIGPTASTETTSRRRFVPFRSRTILVRRQRSDA